MALHVPPGLISTSADEVLAEVGFQNPTSSDTIKRPAQA